MLLYIIIIILFQCTMYKKHTRANSPCSTAQHTHIHNYNSTNSHDHWYSIKSNTGHGWWGAATDDTNGFFHIFSIALATASSLQTLSITITTFSLLLNSFHPSTLSLINHYILDCSSLKYSHLITKWSPSSASHFRILYTTYFLSSLYAIFPYYISYCFGLTWPSMNGIWSL